MMIPRYYYDNMLACSEQVVQFTSGDNKNKGVFKEKGNGFI